MKKIILAINYKSPFTYLLVKGVLCLTASLVPFERLYSLTNYVVNEDVAHLNHMLSSCSFA